MWRQFWDYLANKAESKETKKDKPKEDEDSKDIKKTDEGSSKDGKDNPVSTSFATHCVNLDGSKKADNSKLEDKPSTISTVQSGGMQVNEKSADLGTAVSKSVATIITPIVVQALEKQLEALDLNAANIEDVSQQQKPDSFSTGKTNDSVANPQQSVQKVFGPHPLQKIFGPHPQEVNQVVVTKDYTDATSVTMSEQTPATIIHEQDVAFKKALEFAKVQEEQKQVEMAKAELKIESMERAIADAKKALKAEPDENSNVIPISIRFRTAAGCLIRRFDPSTSVHQVFVYLASEGYLSDHYEATFSPGVPLIDSETSFAEENLDGRFVLYISKKVPKEPMPY